jgi:hypothetical protein
VVPRAAEVASFSRGFTVSNRERRRKSIVVMYKYTIFVPRTQAARKQWRQSWQRKLVTGSIRTCASASVASRTCAATGVVAVKARRKLSYWTSGAADLRCLEPSRKFRGGSLLSDRRIRDPRPFRVTSRTPPCGATSVSRFAPTLLSATATTVAPRPCVPRLLSMFAEKGPHLRLFGFCQRLWQLGKRTFRIDPNVTKRCGKNLFTLWHL